MADSSFEAIRFTSLDGAVRWQPYVWVSGRLSRRLYVTDVGTYWSVALGSYGRFRPKLYRSKRHAEKISKRKLRRMMKKTFTENEEQ